MYNPDEDDVRYEIEVMLGRLDESHIIRTIEYWDVERRRYPSLEHRAVIVAEDITNRFFNVIGLLNQAVPIIALQLNAFQIDNKLVLHFTKVLDITEVPGDIGPGVDEPVDRSYWEKRSNPDSIATFDKLVSLIPSDRAQLRVTLNKYEIAVATSGRQFAWLHPRKSSSHCQANFLIDGDVRSELLEKLGDAGILAKSQGSQYISVRLTGKNISDNEQLVKELLNKCERRSRE